MTLQPVAPKERQLFFNINQKYLYEMTQFYPDEMDGEGNYHYGYFDAYFVDPKRKAFFLWEGDKRVGFAMVNPYSNLGHSPDYTMAEFTIFPAYRRRHYAILAAELILSAYPGVWEIKYHEKNAAAKILWNRVAAPWKPKIYHLNEMETVLEFCNLE